MDLPLFPLHTVLCPGVALPLHIFEERYRLMVGRCIDAGEPFGVVLIREGREVGPLDGRIARVGTTAVIREAGRYPDGRYDLVTVGDRRFRIDGLAEAREPYLMASVHYLEERVGDGQAARSLSERVSARFLRYLELLQPALEDEDGTEIEVEVLVDDELDRGTTGTSGPASRSDPARATHEAPEEVMPGTDGDRRDLLMAAARRLVTPDDPTALSYVLAGLVHVELPARQRLLEARDTETRLRRLDELLRREIGFLGRKLKPLVVDGRGADSRRN